MRLTPVDKKIIKTLYKKGDTSIFWCTDSQAIAERVTKLQDAGILIRDRSKESGYPHVFFRVCSNARHQTNLTQP